MQFGWLPGFFASFAKILRVLAVKKTDKRKGRKRVNEGYRAL